MFFSMKKYDFLNQKKIVSYANFEKVMTRQNKQRKDIRTEEKGKKTAIPFLHI